MISFIESESEIRIYRVSSGNNLDGVASYTAAKAYSTKNVLVSFDDNAENALLIILMYLQIVNTYIYNGYPKSNTIFGFWCHRQTMFSVISQEQDYKMVLQPTFDLND